MQTWNRWTVQLLFQISWSFFYRCWESWDDILNGKFWQVGQSRSKRQEWNQRFLNRIFLLEWKISDWDENEKTKLDFFRTFLFQRRVPALTINIFYGFRTFKFLKPRTKKIVLESPVRIIWTGVGWHVDRKYQDYTYGRWWFEKSIKVFVIDFSSFFWSSGFKYKEKIQRVLN